MRWESENALYAVFSLRNMPAPPNPFPGTRRATLPRLINPPGVDVFIGPKTDFISLQSPRDDKVIYLWGRMGHPDRSGEELLKWCAEIVDGKNLPELSGLVGLFVALIDDRRTGAVHVFTDPLGVRPWFVARADDWVVGGSSVWPIRDAGLCKAALDYHALGSWLYFGYDMTGGSLFEDCRRVEPRCVLTFRDGAVSRREYAILEARSRTPPLSEIADQVCHQVSSAIDLLCPAGAPVIVPLSGGYDSRLIAALVASKHLDARVVVVDEIAGEAAIARQVANTLHLPTRVVKTDGSLWNLFPDPFLAFPEGFPVTRQLVDVIARRHPGIRQLNGFMGDILVRSTGDRADREIETQSADVLTPMLTRRRKLPGLRFDLLETGLAERIEGRAEAAMRALVVVGKQYDRPFLYSGLYGRQRAYVSNNLLQHIDVAEPVTPFYTWEMIRSRFLNDYNCFVWETYELLFRRHFPQIADIPHAGRVGTGARRPPPVSRYMRGAAVAMLCRLGRKDFLPVLSRRKAVHRLLAAAAANPAQEPVVLFLQRLFLLERKLQRAGIPLDWRAL